MKYFLYLFIFTFTITLYSQTSNQMEEIQNIVTGTQHKFAPDKRTALFDVSVAGESGNAAVLKGETNLPAAKEELLKQLAENNLKALDKIEVLPAKNLGDKIYAVINISVASLRTQPKQAAEMATQALMGSTVKLLKKSKGWYLVQTPDKYIAWTEPSSFSMMNETELKSWNESDKIIFTAKYGSVLSKPESDSDPVSDIVAGDILKKTGSEGDFIKVEYPDGRIGFVAKSECADFKSWLADRNPTAENIISTAKRFMGIPYLWGGTSAKAMDCSGFTRTVFFLNGIYLPRDASQQVNVGVAVDTKDGLASLKPGDLLFFGKKATDSTKEKITHVGIYIGNDEFIHEAGLVHISSFNRSMKNFNAYRLNQFVRAKRVLDSIGKNGVEELSKVNY